MECMVAGEMTGIWECSYRAAVMVRTTWGLEKGRGGLRVREKGRWAGVGKEAIGD